MSLICYYSKCIIVETRESRLKESLRESKKMESKLRSRSLNNSSRNNIQSTYVRPSILAKYDRVIFV